MIIPIGHEQSSVRRLPWVTFGVMAVCLIALLLTQEDTYERFGMIPASLDPLTPVSHAFLHAGWGHLLSNLFILFLVGPAIEDRWGRPIFLGFFLLSGVAAGFFHAAMTLHPEIPLVGASGAIAAVMGAALVRLWATKIQFAYFFFFGGIIRGTFWAPVWAMLPLWFASELLAASLANSLGVHTGVAYWAHVGGFAFGVAFALGMRFGNVEERFVHDAIESSLTTRGHPVIEEAMEAREAGDDEGAYRMLAEAVAAHPDDPDVATAFWDVACALERAFEAAPAFQRVVERAVRAGELEFAAQAWWDLVERAPDVRLPPNALLKLVPVLLQSGRPAEAVLALRHVVDERQLTLSPGMALRAVEIARERDPHAAWRAAKRALEAPGLHESKRAKVEALVAELEAQGAAEPPPEIPTSPAGRDPQEDPRALTLPPAEPGAAPLAGESSASPKEEPAPAPVWSLDTDGEREAAATDDLFGPGDLDATPDAPELTEEDPDLLPPDEDTDEDAHGHFEMPAGLAEASDPLSESAAPDLASDSPLGGPEAPEPEPEPDEDDERTQHWQDRALDMALDPGPDDASELRVSGIGDPFEPPDAQTAEPDLGSPDPGETVVAVRDGGRSRPAREPIPVETGGGDGAETVIRIADPPPPDTHGAETVVRISEDPTLAPPRPPRDTHGAETVVRISEDPTLAPPRPAADAHGAETVVRIAEPPAGDHHGAETVVRIAGPDPSPARAPAPPKPRNLDEVVAEAAGGVARFAGAKVAEVVPTSMNERFVALMEASGKRRNLRFEQIEAIGVGAVSGLAPKPVLVIDLILNWNALDARTLRSIRLRSDAFDATDLVSAEGTTDAFRALLDQLLTRSGAVPLPDAKRARGRPFRKFPDLVTYQRHVLQVGG